VKLIRRQPGVHQDVGVELLLLRVRDGLVEPALDVVQVLNEHRNRAFVGVHAPHG